MRISDWSSDVCSSDLAYLYRGVEIRWTCDKSLLEKGDHTPEKDNIHFPNGLSDFLASTLEKRKTLTPEPFVGEAKFPDEQGRVEWALSWQLDEAAFPHAYCNTVPTPDGCPNAAAVPSGPLRSSKSPAATAYNPQARPGH